MEEEDLSDAVYEDSIASQTVVENLNLLTEMLQTIFRGELGLVRDASSSLQEPLNTSHHR